MKKLLLVVVAVMAITVVPLAEPPAANAQLDPLTFFGVSLGVKLVDSLLAQGRTRDVPQVDLILALHAYMDGKEIASSACANGMATHVGRVPTKEVTFYLDPALNGRPDKTGRIIEVLLYGNNFRRMTFGEADARLAAYQRDNLRRGTPTYRNEIERRKAEDRIASDNKSQTMWWIPIKEDQLSGGLNMVNVDIHYEKGWIRGIMFIQLASVADITAGVNDPAAQEFLGLSNMYSTTPRVTPTDIEVTRQMAENLGLTAVVPPTGPAAPAQPAATPPRLLTPPTVAPASPPTSGSEIMSSVYIINPSAEQVRVAQAASPPPVSASYPSATVQPTGSNFTLPAYYAVLKDAAEEVRYRGVFTETAVYPTTDPRPGETTIVIFKGDQNVTPPNLRIDWSKGGPKVYNFTSGVAAGFHRHHQRQILIAGDGPEYNVNAFEPGDKLLVVFEGRTYTETVPPKGYGLWWAINAPTAGQ